jgi:hypothetical protein
MRKIHDAPGHQHKNSILILLGFFYQSPTHENRITPSASLSASAARPMSAFGGKGDTGQSAGKRHF